MIKSELEPEELLAPLEFEETFPSFAELLSTEQKPSFPAPKTEEALSNCKHMMKILHRLLTCYGTMCIIRMFHFSGGCSQQQLKMIQDLRNDFTVFAGQQTERMEVTNKTNLKRVLCFECVVPLQNGCIH